MYFYFYGEHDNKLIVEVKQRIIRLKQIIFNYNFESSCVTSSRGKFVSHFDHGDKIVSFGSF